MKGQYRILMEVMLFALGVAITSFVMVNFQDLRDSADEISIGDQLNTVLNSVINAIVKTSLTPNSMTRVEIPYTVSGHSYKIFVENKYLTALDLNDQSIRVSRKIFNIDEPSNRIEGESYSSAGILEITNDGTKIIVQRG